MCGERSTPGPQDCYEREEDTLCNSTIVTYFLKKFTVNGGEIPRELIDDNLKTDVSWIERLTTVKENTDAMMDALVFDNRLEYDLKQLGYKEDALAQFPHFVIDTCLICVAGNKGFKFFSV